MVFFYCTVAACRFLSFLYQKLTSDCWLNLLFLKALSDRFKDQTFSFSNWLLNSQLQGPGGSRILLCLKDPEGLYFSFFVCILLSLRIVLLTKK